MNELSRLSLNIKYSTACHVASTVSAFAHSIVSNLLYVFVLIDALVENFIVEGMIFFFFILVGEYRSCQNTSA